MRAEVQLTSGLQCWDRAMVHCASPGRGRCVQCVCDVQKKAEWTASQVFLACPL